MPTPTSSVNRGLFSCIDGALSGRFPEGTAAFHFNLYEGTDSVHVQLIGTDSFEAGEELVSDYRPGSETFTTGEEIFEVPFEVAGSDWEQWLETCLNMLRSYIATGERAHVLRSSLGVGAGFVDGDMYVLWQSRVA